MKNLANYRIKKTYIQNIFWIIPFLLFVRPVYFSQIEVLDKAIDILRIIFFGLIILLYVTRKYYSKVSILLLAFVALNIISSIVQEGNIRSALSYAIIGIGAFLMIDILIKKDPRLIFWIILPVFEALIYINLYTIIKYPDGLYTTVQVSGWKSNLSWFLGLRNGMIQWILIAAFLSILNIYCGKRTIKKYLRTGLLLAACIVSVILVNSSTTMYTVSQTSAGGLVAGCLLFGLYFLIPSKIKRSGIISFSNAILLNLSFFLFVVVLRFQDLFSWLIQGVLKKDLTFTGRTLIWDNALQFINEHPLIGLGFEDPIVMSARLKNPAAVQTTHNTFIDILYHGGFLALILLLVSILLIHKSMKRFYKTEISSLISYTVCVFFITAQFEGFSGVTMFILLAFSCNTSSIYNYFKNNLAQNYSVGTLKI